MRRREAFENYVTRQTAPTYAETLQRAFEGRLFEELSTEETVTVLLRTVRALYEGGAWLADELDKLEASFAKPS